MTKAHQPGTVWQWLIAVGAVITVLLGIVLWTVQQDLGVWLGGMYLGLPILIISLLLLALHLPTCRSLLRQVPLLCYGGALLAGFLTMTLTRFLYCSAAGLVPLVITAYALPVYACRRKGWYGVLGCLVAAIPLLILVWYSYPHAVTLLMLAATVLCVNLVAVWSGWYGERRLVYSITAVIGTVFLLIAFLLFLSAVMPNFITNAVDTLLRDCTPGSACEKAVITRQLLAQTPFVGQTATSAAFSEQLLTWGCTRFGWIVLAVAALSTVLMLLGGIVMCVKKRGLPRAIAVAALAVFGVQSVLCLLYNAGVDILAEVLHPISFGSMSYTGATIFMAGLLLYRKGEPEEAYIPRHPSAAEDAPDEDALFLRPEVSEAVNLRRLVLPDAEEYLLDRLCPQNAISHIDPAQLRHLLADYDDCYILSFRGRWNVLSRQLRVLQLNCTRGFMLLRSDRKTDATELMSIGEMLMSVLPDQASVKCSIFTDEELPDKHGEVFLLLLREVRQP